MEMPFCNSETFQLYLDQFAGNNPDEYKIVVLDNGPFHKAKCLKITPNIKLLFLPPYSPELNPAEKIWQEFKRNFTNKHFENMEQISVFLDKAVNSLDEQKIRSITNFEYINDNKF